MAKPTSEARKVRGTSLATKLTFFIGGSVILFMLVFSVFLRSFVRDGMTESLKVAAYEAARTAAHADVEAWGRYFDTPYQGWTRAQIEEKTTSYRNQAELNQAFLTPLEKAIRDRNDGRLAQITEGDTIIVAAEFFFDDPRGEIEREGRTQFLMASYTGEMVYRGGLGTRTEFERGAAEQGLLTIDDRNISVIRGVHAMEDTEGTPAGEFAVYIDVAAVEEATDEMLLQVGYATLLFIALGVIIAQLVGRQVTKPLKVLQDDIRIVASGDLDHHTRAHSSDEIGELARTFDRMTRNLAEAREVERAAARTQKQVSVAAEVTESLMPDKLIAPPGYDVGGDHQSAGALASELYDVIQMADGRIGFVLAKASGTGVPAAILMGMARSTLRAVARHKTDPGETLREANEMLSGDMLRGMYVSCLLVALDPATGTLDIANAGHPPLLLYRAELDKVIVVHSEGIAIGFDAGPVFDETLVVRTMELEKGDRAVLVSEGIPAVQNPQGETLGDGRLLALLKREAPHGADSFTKRMMATIAKFRGRAQLGDDVTIVTLGRPGT